jgi:DHA2 family multidrug resistance protein-like MFS transporter
VPRSTAAAFEENLGAAVPAVERLAEPLASGLLTAARNAYVAGFRLSALISAVLVAGVATMVLLLSRPRG